MPLFTTLETKSHRVKGLSFHPTRPWVLASLINGVIQLWDYRTRSLVERFEEHDGPVRSVDFHITQPLFVSGGDDAKIKVWNYKQKKCLFTLAEHSDYIRTVQFHRDCPWIVSASDDWTVRIWNWQSRQCLVNLTGHNQYVMCAQFHFEKDLLVSASLDQSVRIWDLSGLRQKFFSPQHQISSMEEGLRLPSNEIFGNSDVTLKYPLTDGHDRGVNWAAFHPSNSLMVSGADDRFIKLWRFNEVKAYELETFRGHYHNVTCVIFHPKQDLLISGSEDKTIRVWDIPKRTSIMNFRRENERFWILAAHPHINLFAAGHDAGMIVFKLERERPAYAAYGDRLLYIKDRYFRGTEFSRNAKDAPILQVKRPSSTKITDVAFSAEEQVILINTGSEYEFYLLPKGNNKSLDSVPSEKGNGKAVFLGRRRLAVLHKKAITIKGFKNEDIKTLEGATNSIENIFPADTGMLLIKTDEKVTLYDIQLRVNQGEISTTAEIKQVVWSANFEFVALLAKDTVMIANRKMEVVANLHEAVRVKSGAWDPAGVFLYSTHAHIKYCLPNGDSGIVRTLDSPLYITAVRDSKVFCLDRDVKQRIISIDNTEYMFKLALFQKKFSTVLKMVREYNLVGQAMIAYLQKKGYPEVALHFVKNEKTKFNLALSCGNIAIALECAKALDDKTCWNRLAIEALRQGNHQIVEMAYQKTLNFDKLSFLYLITGNIDKAKKMEKIAEKRKDTMSWFHNSLYLGDVNERVKILERSGQYGLAYACASLHGLTETAEKLKTKIAQNSENPEAPVFPTLPQQAVLLQPPLPIQKNSEENWPLLTTSQSLMDALPSEDEKISSKFATEVPAPEDVAVSAWDDEEEIKPDQFAESSEKDPDNNNTPSEEPENWGEIDFDVPVDPNADSQEGPATAEREIVVLPPPYNSASENWVANSDFAGHHIAAGSFQTAAELLKSQLGVVNFAPLKNHFMSLALAPHLSFPAVGNLPALPTSLVTVTDSKKVLPVQPLQLSNLVDTVYRPAQRSITSGKFTEALAQFTEALQTLALVLPESKQEASEIQELIGICREYIVGIQMELQRKELFKNQQNPKRQAELAAYFTHCNLQPTHLVLSLRSAMNNAFTKMKNYKDAGVFARRLLELNPSKDVETQCKKVVEFCDKNPTNAEDIDYEPRNPFVICCGSFSPIYKGSKSILCPFCGANYKPDFDTSLCVICKISEVGKQVTPRKV